MRAIKVTKLGIVDAVAERSSLKKEDVRQVIEAAFDEIKQALLEDKIVECRGFGTFEVKRRIGRKNARNPRTGETRDVPPYGVATWKPGREIKSGVREYGSSRATPDGR
jgi:integration host factor subunit beta